MRLSITLLSRMMRSEVNIFNGWFGYAMPPYALECVSKREIRKFEWIFRQFKE